MKPTRILAAVILLATLATSQFPPTSVVPVPFVNLGSQANRPDAALLIRAGGTSNGNTVLVMSQIMNDTSLSMTGGWVVNPTVYPNALLTIEATIKAFPQSPFTIAATTVPGPHPCCFFGPWLPRSVAFPNLGIYHLGTSAVPLVDGLGILGGSGSSIITDETGEITLSGTIHLNTTDHLVLQAVVVDATAPLGMSFTAAYAVAKYQ